MAKIAFFIAIISLSLGEIFLCLNYDKEFITWFLSIGIMVMIISILHKLIDVDEFEKEHPLKYTFAYVGFIIFFGIKLPMILEVLF